jgi:hypothetical protein
MLEDCLQISFPAQFLGTPAAGGKNASTRCAPFRHWRIALGMPCHHEETGADLFG